MCVINRDNQVIVTDRSEEIASLQADLSTKDQEIKRLRDLGMSSLDFYIKAAEMRHRNFDAVCDMTLEVIDESESQATRIKDLEQQSEGQKAYIGRLEAAYRAVQELNTKLISQIADQEEPMDEELREDSAKALEKLRKG